MKTIDNTFKIILSFIMVVTTAIMSGETGNRDYLIVTVIFVFAAFFFMFSHGKTKISSSK